MKRLTRTHWILLGLGALAWLGAVIASGLGFNPFAQSWNFTNSGQFGDSFGPLSALMASVAALSAIAAYTSQQGEIARQKLREGDEDARRRKGDFEATFFRLLEAFRSIVADTDVQSGVGAPKEGRDAFRAMVSKFESDVGRTTSHQNAWKMTSAYYRNDLNHYFRFLYHVIAFIKRADGVDNYFYAQLVRALLSEAELILLALNCAYGEGHDKFKPLVEEYALLHNISDKARKKWNLDHLFAEAAFGREVPEPPVS